MSEHECPTCGDEFETERAMKIHHARGHDESLVATTETCHHCGDNFIDERNRNRDTERKFCSEDCRLVWMGSWEGESHPRHNSHTVECEQCGSELTRRQWNIDNYSMHFCNLQCQGDWRAERTGENHPLWEGGRENYGKGWNKTKREAVRERDNHECQHCGLDGETHVERHGRKLDVHHITPARKFDDPLERNAMDNLITLCQGQCHHTWEEMAPLRPQVCND